MSSESQNISLAYLKIFVVGIIVFSAIIDGFCQIPLFKKNAIINLSDNQHISGDSLVIDDMIFVMNRLNKNSGAFMQIQPWTDGLVYYDFSSTVTESTKTLFFNSFDEWEKDTPIRFLKRNRQRNYILIIQSSKNSSHVGMIGYEQHLYIKTLHKGIVMHELGHALGLAHEHQRTDRDDFINILYENVESEKKSNFESLNGSILYTPYDFLSIMHYFKAVFSKNGQNTIEPKAEYIEYLDKIGQRDSLTVSDKLAIKQLYNRIPALLSPLNGKTDVDPGGTVISWAAIPGAIQFQLQLSRNRAFTLDVIDKLFDSNDPDYTRIYIQEEFVSNFDPYVTYYWRIRSIPEEGGPGEWSEVFEFTTKSNRVEDYSLDPAYPNPFQKSTTIQFELKYRAYVEIKIFDILGKETDRLASKTYLRGIHKIKWNSDELPSGLYFCQLRAGTAIQTIKLVLCR